MHNNLRLVCMKYFVYCFACVVSVKCMMKYKQIHSDFEGRDQQDAQEAITVILSSFEEVQTYVRFMARKITRSPTADLIISGAQNVTLVWQGEYKQMSTCLQCKSVLPPKHELFTTISKWLLFNKRYAYIG